MLFTDRYSMTAMMSLLVAFLACVDVCFIHNVNCSLAECFLRISMGDMSLSVQEYAIWKLLMTHED